MKLTKQEQDYLDTERMIFDNCGSYELNINKSIVEFTPHYTPTTYLIKILRKKYQFPTGKFDVIYMDMPWKYNNGKTGGTHTSGASQKYNTIPTGTLRFELSVLINSIAKPNAVLFMWLTAPMEREQLTVLDTLDFVPKSKVFWHKTGRLGMGFWFRHQVEFMVMAVRGEVKAFRTARRNIIEAPFQKHSQKPSEFREFIEDVTSGMGKVKKIELFARSKAKGWKSWGDQL